MMARKSQALKSVKYVIRFFQAARKSVSLAQLLPHRSGYPCGSTRTLQAEPVLSSGVRNGLPELPRLYLGARRYDV